MGTCVHFSRALPSNSWWQTMVGWQVLSRPSAAEDWGGALAMDWARRHPDAMRGIVYFETMVRPRSWDEMDQSARSLFKRLRSPEGEELVLKENVFIEKILPARILRS